MNEQKEKVDDKEVTQSVTKPKEEYAVGDIVWAKIAGCPYWPSIVCYDPATNLYIKNSGERKNFSLHVRFCSYYGQRSWAKFIEEYTTRDKLLKKYPDCFINLKKNKKEMFLWESAIKEADNLLKMERKKRILHFCTTYRLDYFKEFVDKVSPETHVQISNQTASGSRNNAKILTNVLKEVNNKSNINGRNENSNAQGNNAGNNNNAQQSQTGVRLYTLEEQKQLVIDTYGYVAYNPQAIPEIKEKLEIKETNVKHEISYTDDFKRRITMFEKELKKKQSTSPTTD